MRNAGVEIYSRLVMGREQAYHFVIRATGAGLDMRQVRCLIAHLPGVWGRVSQETMSGGYCVHFPARKWAQAMRMGAQQTMPSAECRRKGAGKNMRDQC